MIFFTKKLNLQKKRNFLFGMGGGGGGWGGGESGGGGRWGLV